MDEKFLVLCLHIEWGIWDRKAKVKGAYVMVIDNVLTNETLPMRMFAVFNGVICSTLDLRDW